MRKISLFIALAAITCLGSIAHADLAGDLAGKEIKTKPSEWQGFKRLDFALPADGAKCSIIAPKEAAEGTHRQPRDKETLKPIAEAKVPISLVIGEADEVVPAAENADPLAANYRELGGAVKVWRKPRLGHPPHGLSPVEPLLEAILATKP